MEINCLEDLFMDVSKTPTEVWSGVDGKSSDRVGGTLKLIDDAYLYMISKPICFIKA